AEEPREIGPDVERVVKRAQFQKEYDDAVEEVKQRAVRVFGELVLHEIEVLVFDGFDKVAAYLPAVNNLAMRKKGIQDELIAEVGRLQGELRRKLEWLAKDEQEF